MPLHRLCIQIFNRRGDLHVTGLFAAGARHDGYLLAFQSKVFTP